MFDVKPKGRKAITPIPLVKNRPAYSINTIKKIRDELIDIIGFKYLELPFNDDLAMRYLTDYCAYMKWTVSHLDTLYQSIYYYMKKYPIFTKEACDEVAYRLAGAYLQSHAGEVLPIKGSKILNTWLGVEIVYAQLSRIRMNKQLVMLKFNVTAGSVAGTVYSQEFPASAVSKVFKESLKFNKYKSLQVQELFGMQLLAYLTMTESGDIQFTQIAVNNHQHTFNSKLRAERKKDCEHGLQLECVDCPVGSDRCARATHLLTYEIQPCKNTLVPYHENYTDPELKSGYCSHCAKLQATGTLYKEATPKV